MRTLRVAAADCQGTSRETEMERKNEREKEREEGREEEAKKGFLPNIYHEVLLSCGVWMYTDTPGVLSKSQDITEYCD